MALISIVTDTQARYHCKSNQSGVKNFGGRMSEKFSRRQNHNYQWFAFKFADFRSESLNQLVSCNHFFLSILIRKSTVFDERYRWLKKQSFITLSQLMFDLQHSKSNSPKRALAFFEKKTKTDRQTDSPLTQLF